MGKYTDKVQGLFTRPATTFEHSEASHPTSKRKADEKPATESVPAQEEPTAQDSPRTARADEDL